MKVIVPALLFLTVIFACAPQPAEQSEAPAPEAVATAEISPSLAWPRQLRATGTTTQTPSGDPPSPPPIVVHSTPSAIRYEWDEKKMYTAFDPACPALLTEVSGSDDYPCSYFFQDGDLYYVYQDQKMTAAAPTTEVSCCIIRDFSMLGFHFPEYVRQYDDHMTQLGATCTPSQLPTLPASAVTMGTPGAGFYAYDPEQILRHGDGAWVTPLGFGGGTPNSAFTSLMYDEVIPFPADIAEIALPEICQSPDVPACMNCDTSGTCSGDLTVLFEALKDPRVAGCVLCHNTFDELMFPPERMAKFSACSCGGCSDAAEGDESQLVARSW